MQHTPVYYVPVRLSEIVGRQNIPTRKCCLGLPSQNNHDNITKHATVISDLFAKTVNLDYKTMPQAH